jgi:hypothetical protein
LWRLADSFTNADADTNTDTYSDANADSYTNTTTGSNAFVRPRLHRGVGEPEFQ